MPGTTPVFAYPYPLGTDLIADGDDSIKALAQRVELKGTFKHVGSGNRLDAASLQPSQPDSLILMTGLASLTFSANAAVLVFPAPGFPNGVLFLGLTTVAGSAGATLVSGGAVSKTQATLYNPSNGTFTIGWAAIGY